MKDLTIKELVEFRRRKSETTKRNFVASLQKDKKKEETESGGGDYWISCLSALANSFKLNKLQPIIDRREELEEKHEEEQRKLTKDMYKRNIDVLYNYEDLDLKAWRPAKVLFLKKPQGDAVLTIKGLQIKVKPHHVFTFQRGDTQEIGAIWFVAKLNGLTKDELGMFADGLFRYLKTHYGKHYNLNPKYCIAVDVFHNTDINYLQLADGDVLRILGSTLEEMKKLMK